MRRAWRCSDVMGRRWALVSLALALCNVVLAWVGPLWLLNWLTAVFCLAFVPLHLRLGCRRADARWWREFNRRRANWRWN